MRKIDIFDSTLRDGAQAAGISFSVNDKIKICKYLDNMGIKYIEAGNPGSNPKDQEFFERVKNEVKFYNSSLVAFGSTRRKNVKVEEDNNVLSLINAGTEYVCIFGKAWDFHATKILGVSLEENLLMIEETISYLKNNGKKVIFDAEHFFDGYKHNREYSLEVLKTAEKAGAVSVCLCDTNGGCFPDEVYNIVKDVCANVSIEVGIHTHNDTGMAVANSMMAVEAGASNVQGTFIGVGERTGNANLSTIIANLMLHRGYDVVKPEYLKNLTSTALKISEISNIRLDNHMPYVGANAFTHKAGMHIDGVKKASTSFEHVPPESVGNERKFLMSEVAGRSTLVEKIKKYAPNVEKDSPIATEIIKRVKELEFEGYQFEGADGTFELLVRRALGTYKPFFTLENFKIIEDNASDDDGFNASAMVKLSVNGKTEISAAEGNGPVNALDKALRKALCVFYPSLDDLILDDYKVRVLETGMATASKVRVLIETRDKSTNKKWSTVGVSTDVIEASWIALVDSIEIKLSNE
ncbi:MAG: citramalate synthase [Acholeplasmatales bacterium]|nr:citramalate synthase [Acholeplasmatales bacterium]